MISYRQILFCSSNENFITCVQCKSKATERFYIKLKKIWHSFCRVFFVVGIFIIKRNFSLLYIGKDICPYKARINETNNKETIYRERQKESRSNQQVIDFPSNYWNFKHRPFKNQFLIVFRINFASKWKLFQATRCRLCFCFVSPAL